MARELKSLKPSGGDSGYRHREHRSKKGRRKRDVEYENKIKAWWVSKGHRKIKKQLKRSLREIIQNHNH